MTGTYGEASGQPQSIFEFATRLRAQLSAAGDFDRHALDLARLFRHTFGRGALARALQWELQTALLRATLERARAGTAFYRSPAYEAWNDTPPGQPPDLSCWPVIDRHTVEDHFDDFLSNEVTYSFTCHTSGSTGKPLSIYKSFEEIRFIRDYFSELFAPMVRDTPSQPLILSFPNVYHGVAIPIPSPGKVFVSGVTDDTLIQDAASVLRASYNIRGHDHRISIISGLLHHVHFFTSYLLEQGYDLRTFGVRALNVSGGAVSKHVSRFLADAWGAMVFDRYSLTEIFGGGYRCVHCGHFHLDPHVIGEVVDVDTGEVLRGEGVGRLVLTSLHPFVQMHPLVRYDPGDLVRSMPTSCGPELAFDFLGKEKNCLRWKRNGKTEWLLFSIDAYDCLGEIPDVNVYEWFRNVTVAHDRTVGARQLYVTSMHDGEHPVIDLQIELRYAPHAFASRVAELRARILDYLRAAQTSLAQRLDDGSVTLDIQFLPPGALGNQFIIKT